METQNNLGMAGLEPGRDNHDMPLDDFNPPRNTFVVVMAALLGLPGILGVIWGWMRLRQDQPALLILALSLMLIALGMISLLSRFVQTPA